MSRLIALFLVTACFGQAIGQGIAPAFIDPGPLIGAIRMQVVAKISNSFTTTTPLPTPPLCPVTNSVPNPATCTMASECTMNALDDCITTSNENLGCCPHICSDLAESKKKCTADDECAGQMGGRLFCTKKFCCVLPMCADGNTAASSCASDSDCTGKTCQNGGCCPAPMCDAVTISAGSCLTDKECTAPSLSCQDGNCCRVKCPIELGGDFIEADAAGVFAAAKCTAGHLFYETLMGCCEAPMCADSTRAIDFCDMTSDCNDPSYTCQAGSCCPAPCPPELGGGFIQTAANNGEPLAEDACSEGYFFYGTLMGCCKEPTCAQEGGVSCKSDGDCGMNYQVCHDAGYCCDKAKIDEACTDNDECAGDLTTCDTSLGTCQCGNTMNGLLPSEDKKDCAQGPCPTGSIFDTFCGNINFFNSFDSPLFDVFKFFDDPQTGVVIPKECTSDDDCDREERCCPCTFISPSVCVKVKKIA